MSNNKVGASTTGKIANLISPKNVIIGEDDTYSMIVWKSLKGLFTPVTMTALIRRVEDVMLANNIAQQEKAIGDTINQIVFTLVEEKKLLKAKIGMYWYYEVNPTATPPSNPIVPSEEVIDVLAMDKAIWKFFSDYIPHTFDEAASTLSKSGFTKPVIRERLADLLNANWFVLQGNDLLEMNLSVLEPTKDNPVVVPSDDVFHETKESDNMSKKEQTSVEKFTLPNGTIVTTDTTLNSAIMSVIPEGAGITSQDIFNILKPYMQSKGMNSIRPIYRALSVMNSRNKAFHIEMSGKEKLYSLAKKATKEKTDTFVNGTIVYGEVPSSIQTKVLLMIHGKLYTLEEVKQIKEGLTIFVNTQIVEGSKFGMVSQYVLGDKYISIDEAKNLLSYFDTLKNML